MNLFEIGKKIEEAGLKIKQFDAFESYVWRIDGFGSLTANYKNGEYVGYVINGSEQKIEELATLLGMGGQLVNQKSLRKNIAKPIDNTEQ